MSNQKRKHHGLDEHGFASIVISLVLIVVLSLITVGFAQLARREQRSALDKQLAIQANYAAESGVNDALKALPALDPATDPNTCLTPIQLQNAGGSIDPNTDVSYTCVLVNLKPPDLKWTSVQPDQGQSLIFSTIGNLGSITVNWRTVDGHATPRPAGGFTPVGSWGNSPAVVKFSITPLNNLSRDALISNTFTTYLYPSSGSGSVNYDPVGNQGPIIKGNCNGAGDYPCKVTINGLNSTPPILNESYLIHFQTYYDQLTDISVSNATDATTGSQLDFVGGQAQIDATGRAKNVLKRMQVRVCKDSNVNTATCLPLPNDALEAQSLCKRFDTYSGTTSYDTPTDSSCTLGPGP